jgi:hypothetical protein
MTLQEIIPYINSLHINELPTSFQLELFRGIPEILRGLPIFITTLQDQEKIEFSHAMDDLHVTWEKLKEVLFQAS